MATGPTPDLTPPTVYLVRRGLSKEKLEQLRDYLAITPIGAVLITTLGDLEYAKEIGAEWPTKLSSPIVIVGDFDHDFAEMGSTTTWKDLPIRSK